MQIHPFLETLVEYRELVWRSIESYLDTKMPGVSSLQNPELEEFHRNLMWEYPKRKGKYFRPSLLLLMAEGMGMEREKAIMSACAMQISEDWILIHDDVEDNSLERRGKTALQRMYSPALAVNAGDALHVVMWKMLRDNFDVVGTEKALQIMDEFSRMLSRTVLGQTVEIAQVERKNYSMTEEDVNFILDGKTGYYTVAGPLRLGAILACDDNKKLGDILPKIDEFGTYLGRAFQIIDDILDLTTDFEGLKKQMGNDIYESKRTVILIHLLENCSQETKTKVLEILNKSREEKTEEEVSWVTEKMQESKSLDFAYSRVVEYCKIAREKLEEMDFIYDRDCKQKLRDCIDFVATRKH